MDHHLPKIVAPRYISCIRINGKPILPPLVKDADRSQLLEYRCLAAALEQKIKERRKIKDNRHSVDSGVVVGLCSDNSLRSPQTQYAGVEKKGNHLLDRNGKNVDLRIEVCDDPNLLGTILYKSYDDDDEVLKLLSQYTEEQISITLIEALQSELSLNCEQVFEENSHSVSYDENGNSSVLENEFQFREQPLPLLYPKNSLRTRCANNTQAGTTAENSNICNEECEGAAESELFSSSVQISSVLMNNITSSIGDALPTTVMETMGENDNVGRGGIPEEPSNRSPCEVSGHNLESYILNSNSVSGCNNKSRNDYLSDIVSDLFSSFDGKEKKSNSWVTKDEKISRHQSIGEESKLGNSGNVDLQSSAKDTKCQSDYDSATSLSLETPEREKQPMKHYNPAAYENKPNSDLEEKNMNAGQTQKKWICDDIENSSDTTTDITTCTIDMSGHCASCNSAATSVKHSTDVVLTSRSMSESEMDLCSSTTATLTAEEERKSEKSLDKGGDSMPPRLVRQNSYTLETPSPVLLAHLEASKKQEDKSPTETESISSGKTKAGRKGWDLAKAKESWEGEIEGSLVYAVPCKQSQAVRRIENTSTNKTKDNKLSQYKVSSLPGSIVSSPIKVRPYHGSLECLPVATNKKIHPSKPGSARHSREQSPGDHSKAPLGRIFRYVKQPSLFSNKDILLNSLSLSELKEWKKCYALRTRSKSDLQDRKSPKKVHQYHIHNSKAEKDFDMLLEPDTKKNPKRSKCVSEEPKNERKQTQINYDAHRLDLEDSKECKNDPPSKDYSGALQNSKEKNGSTISLHTVLDPTVQAVFVQLQNQHSQLMCQLLDRQKKEQEALANTFLSQQKEILRELNLIPSPVSSKSQSGSPPDVDVQRSRETSPESSARKRSLTEPQIHKLVAATNCSNLPANGYHRPMSPPVNRKLFRNEVPAPLSPRQEKRNKEREKAATIINAAARSYLTRRLLKTEYIQDIINTISDTVQCALQLQRECPVDIAPSDVELHRRLIQQLTAACYTLHDAFFTSSVQERMAVIACDREKQRNQVSRPTSARSARTSLSTATQKYLQRKQQQLSTRSERPSSSRRNWCRSKSYSQSPGQYMHSNTHSKPQVPVSSRAHHGASGSRRPWR